LRGISLARAAQLRDSGEVLVAALAGTLAGFVHVLSGPDHLAAVAPLASDGDRRSWRAGALWGLGHSSGVLIVGVAALLVRGWLPIESLSSWSERIVGVVLIGIGLWGFHRVFRGRGDTHPHPHPRAAFGVGILHGLAGSSHFLGVLPALALPGMAASLGYLGGFGVGTVAAMSGFATVIGLIGARTRHRGPTATRWLLSACSTMALLVGIAWLSL
jgi:hypothetical protein